ncbi:MAG: beta-ketoacyl synthase chain length factor [Kiritimatiellae bacterium]|nr:beta-ketoacyl synthase chain length factor [Kiritimatiellia bacterium]
MKLVLPLISGMAKLTADSVVRTFFHPAWTKPVFVVSGETENRPDLRTLHLLSQTVDRALAQAGLVPDDLRNMRVGVCLGTTVGCQFCTVMNDLHPTPAYGRFLETGTADPQEGKDYLSRNPAEWLVRRLGLPEDVPAVCVTNACSSGADAIGVATSWIRSGRCDLVIAGGCDSLSAIPFSGFSALGVYSDNPCKPFAEDRDGLTLGEGAGILILETEASLRVRGVSRSLAVLGYGSSCDAYHLTAPDPSGAGLRRAVQTALMEAGVAPSEITAINPHGTATRNNDAVEQQVLGELLSTSRILPTKNKTGHTLGAAGAIEAVFAAELAREGAVLSTSLAFGGSNAALVIGPADLPRTPCVDERDPADVPYEKPAPGKSIPRRASGFARLAVEGVCQAAQQVPDGIARTRVGLILATAFGAHRETFAFADELLEDPELPPSPLRFSHTVHNAAAAYSAIAAGIHGPCLTLCAFRNVRERAEELATYWIDSGFADAVIVGQVDESHSPLVCFVPTLENMVQFDVIARR